MTMGKANGLARTIICQFYNVFIFRVLSIYIQEAWRSNIAWIYK